MMQIADLCVIIFTVSFMENALFAKGFAFDGTEKLPTDKKTFFYFSVMLLLGAVITDAVLWALLSYVFPQTPFMAVVAAPILTLFIMIGLLFGTSKLLPKIYRRVKPFSLLLTANTATVGIVFSVSEKALSFTDSIIFTALGVLGVILAFVIFDDIHERIYEKRQPGVFRGLPGALIAAGLAAMVFVGISGIDFPAFR